MSFADLGVPDALVSQLARREIFQPFPIQSAALPDALAGRDIVGQAPTGSGKTLAFGIALVVRTGKAASRRPRGLVLVPTRELAAQVQKELAQLAPERGKRVLCIYGGTSYNVARKSLQMGVDIVVACPGRLEDLLEQGTLSLGDVETVVIDEADRMADMGFLPAVRRIVKQCRSDRHTMLFSATLGPDVKSLVNEFTVDAAHHDVIDDAEPADVDHFFWSVTREDRVNALVEIANRHGRAIVFTRTKHGADRLARQLEQRGVAAAAIHGDRTQAQRERALRDTRNGHVDFLVATDVAARGIHIDSLPCVVHFDPPTQATDYLHRSGRTGRAGAEGVVISLVGSDVERHVRQIRNVLGVPGASESPDSATAHRFGRVDDAAAAQKIDDGPVRKPSSNNGPRGGARGRSSTSDVGRADRPASRRPAKATRFGSTERPSRDSDSSRGARRDSDARPARQESSPRPARASHDRHSPRGDARDRSSAPSRDDAVATVAFFNESKGYGFATDASGRDHFIHFSNIVGDGFKTLEAGQKVSFDSAEGPKGLEARNVRPLQAQRRR